MGCDANAHHFHWGSSDTNARVKTLSSVNEVEKAVNHVTSILVDSYEASCPLTYPDWDAYKEAFNKYNSEIKKAKRKSWAHHFHWGSSDTNARVKTLSSVNEVEKAVNHVTSILVDSYEASCPLTYPDWDAYKEAFNKYNSEIKKAKRKSWVCFSESIETEKDITRFRRMLSKDPKSIASIKREDGTWTNSDLETLDLLAATHFPNCADVSDPQSDPIIRNAATVDRSDIEEIISRPKIAWDLNTFKPYKSPGPDGIIPAMMQNASELLIPSLEKLIKNIKGDIDGPVTIYVDSQAALKSLMSYSIKSAVVLDCIKVLSNLKSAVTLCWVPGHFKIVGNEMADELTRRGSEPQDIIIENSVKPPLCYFYAAVRTGLSD
ncbi:uncharacterized protein [Musca autumnalis]|uniref:uncharacterized protein n=1 Tax=Musca autumnalis TaxID=221902 RepID=UPI003CE8A774